MTLLRETRVGGGGEGEFWGGEGVGGEGREQRESGTGVVAITQHPQPFISPSHLHHIQHARSESYSLGQEDSKNV